mgnify:CR=1 FL=1
MSNSANDLEISARIAKAVKDSGGQAFFVGGYVRDKILGRNSKDIDIEIHGITESQLIEILHTIGEPLSMGASFGIWGLRHYGADISLPRSLTTGEIDPFTGYLNAAKRRDFTMNALMQDVLTGEILDFFGGVNDIHRHIIRHVDDSTFLLDPLRVIRAARFSASLGFTVDDSTRQICSSADISRIAPERVYSELENALTKTKSPSRFFAVLAEMNQLSSWFAEAVNADIDILDMAERVRDKSSYAPGFMLAMLCHDWREDDIAQFLSRLTNDIRLTRYVLNMAGLADTLSRMPKDSPELSYMQIFDASECPDDLPLMSEILAGDSHSDMLRLYHERMSLPYVTGGDILRHGVQQGRLVGEALRHIHALRLSGIPKAEQLREAMKFITEAES